MKKLSSLSIMLIVMIFVIPIANANYEAHLSGSRKDLSPLTESENGTMISGQVLGGYFAVYRASHTSTTIKLNASSIVLYGGVSLTTRTNYQINQESKVRFSNSDDNFVTSQALRENSSDKRMDFTYFSSRIH